MEFSLEHVDLPSQSSVFVFKTLDLFGWGLRVFVD